MDSFGHVQNMSKTLKINLDIFKRQSWIRVRVRFRIRNLKLGLELGSELKLKLKLKLITVNIVNR